MLEDVAFARASFAAGFEHPDQLSAEHFRTWLEPLFKSLASTRNLERFIASFDNKQTVAVAPLLRRLEAPTLIVWGTSDPFFPVKWAYWLRGAIPGRPRGHRAGRREIVLPVGTAAEQSRAACGFLAIGTENRIAAFAVVCEGRAQGATAVARAGAGTDFSRRSCADE